MKVSTALILGLLVGCASVDKTMRNEALPAMTVLADGCSLNIEIDGRYFRAVEYGQNRTPRISDFWFFEGSSRIQSASYARVSRVGAEVKIALIGNDGAIIGTKAFPVVTIEDNGQIVVRHQERKESGDEWGSIYYIQREDFFVTEDGDFFLHAHSSGIRRTLLVVPTPWKHQTYVLFPKKKPNKALQPTPVAVTQPADAACAPATCVAEL